MKKQLNTNYIKAKQIKNFQKIKVSWKYNKKISSIIINIKHNNKIHTKLNITDNSIIEKGYIYINAFYGKQIVFVKLKNSSNKNLFYNTISVNLTSDEYIIAPLTATMPVTMFTFYLKEISKNYTIPTFIWFKRQNVWNYKYMPKNVNFFHFCKTNANLTLNNIYKKVSLWIKELHELNPNSKFKFFYDDCDSYGFILSTFYNSLPKENYTVTLLSDGYASFLHLKKCFDNKNYLNIFNNMKESYLNLKNLIEINNKSKINFKNLNFNIKNLCKYSFVFINTESNFDWWLCDENALSTKNLQLFTKIKKLINTNKIKIKNFSNQFSNFTEKEKIKFKKLFNFNNSLFKKTNKKILLFIGTWNEKEYYFEDYLNILKLFYPNNFVYYYKGHPHSPTNLIKGKTEKLKKLSFNEINSNIPAELILFFNPNIYICGYYSSTFYSINSKNSTIIFNTLKNNLNKDYCKNFKYFITKINKTNKFNKNLNTSKNCFLIEYNNSTNLSILDLKTKKITHLKK